MRSKKVKNYEAWGALISEMFLSRKVKNPLYSYRALARDLHVSHSLISLIINRKRVPSQRSVKRMLESVTGTSWEASFIDKLH